MAHILHVTAKSFRRQALMMAGLLVMVGPSLDPRALAQQELPESVRRSFEAGVAAEKAGRLDEAEKDFQSVLRQGGGTVASVHNNLGIVYQLRADHAQAIAQFREAIRLQPAYLAPHVLLGASLLAMGKIPEAVQELDRAVMLDPKQPQVRMELAKVNERAGNLAGAVEQYRVLRKLDPRNPEYAYQAGQAYLKLSQWCLEQMRRLDPASPRVSESLAEIYRHQGRSGDAIRAYRRALQAGPKLPGIHLAMAQIYLEQGNLGEARRQIELELALVPESVAAKAIQQRIQSAEQERE